MKQHTGLTRRRFLRAAALGAWGVLVGGGTAGIFSGCSNASQARKSSPGVMQTGQEPDLEVNLSAVQTEQSLFEGAKTKVWQYQARVVRGDASSVQDLPASYLGPIFRVKKGQRVRVNFTNQVTEPTIVHWHGLHLPQEMDGHPMYAIEPGETYRYDFQVQDRAGTYWFHPHPDQLTGPQVYRGLAGLFIVSDDEEAQAGLPAGEFDVPLVIQDRAVDANNQFVYLSGGMPEQMMGVLGDTILVNGQPDFVLPAAASTYRLRLLNGSNSRIYKLAWKDGTPLTVIGTDGGLLETAVQRSYVMLGPAERVELWVDLQDQTVGSQMSLVSLPFSAGVSGMMGMMGSRSPLANGDPFPVLTVRLDREGSGQKASLPEKLSTIQHYQEQEAVNQRQPRTFTLGMSGMGGMMGGGREMGWTINGRTFEMEGVARDEVVKLNTLEVWQYDNQSDGVNGGMGPGRMGRGMGGMMQMPHPMHVHGLQFQVIGWDIDPSAQSIWDSVKEGFVTEGWKDTVLVMPGTRARILLKFQDFPGLFLNHCHNLEHEDLGMMRNYRIDA